MIKESEVLKIGYISKPHGVDGELTFIFTHNLLEEGDSTYIVCLIDGILVPFFIEHYIIRSNGSATLKLEGVDSLERAKDFINQSVFYPKKSISEDISEDLEVGFLVGFKLKDQHNHEIGEVLGIDDSTINTLFIVSHPGGELLIPYQEELLLDIDEESRFIQLEIPEGLLETLLGSGGES